MRAAPHAQQAVSQNVEATIADDRAAGRVGDFFPDDTNACSSPAPTEFLTGPDVQRRYRRSSVTIWRWLRDPEMGFPAPLQINGYNFWRLSDLTAWEESQKVAA